MDFITFWIDNHGENVVDKLSLRLTVPENVGEVIERCISFATQHGVKEMELDFSHPSWDDEYYYFNVHDALFELPSHVYEHSCLEYLRLFSCSFVEMDMVNFHALKEVSLGWMQVRVTAIKASLSNCKILESLSLKRCWSLDEFDIGEDRLMLRKLVMDKCNFGFLVFNVNAPNLRIFNYSRMMTFYHIKICSPKMEEANLDFSPESGFEGLGHFLCDLVQCLFTVRVLTVRSYFLQVIPTEDDALRMRRDMNVRHLIMKTALHEHEFMGITLLLNSCPKLERLTIEFGYVKAVFGYEPPFDINFKRFWIGNVRPYICMRSTLKEVEIKNFRGTMNEIHVLRFFIIGGKVMKRIGINILKEDVVGDGINLEAQCLRMAKYMLKAPRRSSDLEISIC